MSSLDKPNPDDAPTLLSYSDLIGLSLSLNKRVDTLWQRVIYAHAAIVGVMVFLATTTEVYVVTRLLVLFFYTLNTGISIAAFMETFAGLRAVFQDLKAYPPAKGAENLQQWVREQSYHRHARRRVWLLGIVWILMAYLMLYPIWVLMNEV